MLLSEAQIRAHNCFHHDCKLTVFGLCINGSVAHSLDVFLFWLTLIFLEFVQETVHTVTMPLTHTDKGGRSTHKKIKQFREGLPSEMDHTALHTVFTILSIYSTSTYYLRTQTNILQPCCFTTSTPHSTSPDIFQVHVNITLSTEC